MSDKTGIEWTDATWNPVTGCSKVSQGCKHCYALRDWPRMSANPKTVYYGRKFTDVRCHPERLDQPLRWKRPRRIFVNSMSDLFHEMVPDRFIADVFGVMAAAPWHTFQVLTKRSRRALELLGAGRMASFENDVEECMALYSNAPMVWPLPNVWLGVSVEDQATADDRIPLLLQIPAAVRWISAEPLLGAINIGRYFYGAESIDWVVAGGESGLHARPMHPDWLRGLRDQCDDAAVPFLFKQWGEWAPTKAAPVRGQYTGGELFLKPDGQLGSQGDWWDGKAAAIDKVGKKAAGRLLDDVQHDGYPVG